MDKSEESPLLAEESSPSFPKDVDPYLALLIVLANKDLAGMSTNAPITVWVKGTQFSGLVVATNDGQVEFMRTFLGAYTNPTVTFAGGATPEVEESVRRVIQSTVSEIGPRIIEQVRNSQPPQSFGYLTLRNARVWANARNSLRTEYIRIRLDQIDAFILGEPTDD